MTDDERRRHWHEGEMALGEGVLLALRTQLEALGATVTALGPETCGWSMRVRAGQEWVRVHVISTTAEPDVWELRVMSPHLGVDGEASLIATLDRALRSIPELTRVEWDA